MDIPYTPYARGFYADPRPVYRRLRDEAPAYWSEACNFWVLSRYEDVRGALANWRAFSIEAGAGVLGPLGELFNETPNLLMMDPPRHTQLRKVLAGVLTPDRMLNLKEQVRSVIVDLLAPFEGQARMDLTQDFAEPLPALVIADLLGIPRQDAPMLMEAVDKLSDHERGDIARNTLEALNDLRDYYEVALRERRRRPAGEDILWRLLEAEDAGILTHAEGLGFAILVTIAGGETTTKMIGNMALALHANPGERELLVGAPELLRNAVEEALRYNSSTHMLTRTLTEDVESHGETMRAGQTVALLFNAANNDERKFADPDRFDIRRPLRGDHLAFGGGIHACLGAPLARLELQLAFEEFLKRWPTYEVDHQGLRQYYNPFTTGYRNLPLVFP
jgi:cytochrome P450